MIFSSIGAIDSPSPVTSVVMPWVILDAARPSTRTLYSDCPSRSMNPGATTRPDASIVRLAAAHADVGREPGSAGPVHDSRVGEQDVVRSRFPRRRSGGAETERETE